jgi:tRNA-splicing ligase RtcB
MTLIRKRIPVGFNKHSDKQEIPELLFCAPFKEDFNPVELYPVSKREITNALKSLGTLGGGNHFIEIQKGSDGYIWFMLHSGSRNLGLKVAKAYNEKAKELNKTYFSSIPEEYDLAFLPIGTEEADDYIREMNICLDFAQANRDLMVERIKKSFTDKLCLNCNGKGGKKGSKCEVCDGKGYFEDIYEDIEFEETINIHHNYAAIENHFGQNVWIHRKGATSAKEGQLGIIPGSQGTASYIVKGKGNPESFMSCSHGARRVMSRTKARKELDLEKEKQLLDSKGIIHSIRSKDDLDEASSAYKNIDTVMNEQKDLVDILVKLEPLAVVKG